MSVVIRGIDKPSDCDYCPFQTHGYCDVLLSYINVEHGVDTRCPIIEINEYTMKNGHKVVVADTPQTDLLVKTPHKSREIHEKNCETCRDKDTYDEWQGNCDECENGSMYTPQTERR